MIRIDKLSSFSVLNSLKNTGPRCQAEACDAFQLRSRWTCSRHPEMTIFIQSPRVFRGFQKMNRSHNKPWFQGVFSTGGLRSQLFINLSSNRYVQLVCVPRHQLFDNSQRAWNKDMGTVDVTRTMWDGHMSYKGTSFCRTCLQALSNVNPGLINHGLLIRGVLLQ